MEHKKDTIEKPEILEKGFKEKIASLATVASLLGVPYSQAQAPAPAKQQYELKAEPDKDLRPIAYIESRNGARQKHKQVNHGLNRGTTAIGIYGFMPIEVQDTIRHDNKLKEKYGHLLNIHPVKESHKIEKFLMDNPAAQHELANSHWHRINGIFKKNKDRAVYAWNNGIHGAATAPAAEIKNSPYVKEYHKFKKMLDLEGERRPPNPAGLGKSEGKKKKSKAHKELETKSLNEIQHDTAITWKDRAVAAYKNFQKTEDPKWKLDGEEYRHEACEHASLVFDVYPDLLKSISDEIELYRGNTTKELDDLAKFEDLEKALMINPRIREIADDYAGSKGMKLNHDVAPVTINPAHGLQIANEYEKIQHAPHDKDVKQAYGSLINETKDQYKHLLSNGFKFSPIQPGQANPYPSSKHMMADVHNNKHLWYYPTELGFGSDGQVSDHPMLDQTEFKDKHGKKMVANDIFRQVHDVFGHSLYGNGFGPAGEHRAYLAHKQMYSPSAQKALATETMGQNNWVNWSASHGQQNRNDPVNTHYAEQKAGLFPDHVINTDWHKDNVAKSEQEVLQKDEKFLTHYSQHAEPLLSIDPNYHGEGATGKERNRPGRAPRSYYYDDEKNHEPVVLSGAKYKYKVPHPGNIIDLGGEDAQHIKNEAKNEYGIIEPDRLEQVIQKQGYHGYKNSKGTHPNIVAVFHPLKPTYIEKLENPLGKSEDFEGLQKSKNVREQRAKVFGTKANPSLKSPMREKHINHIVDFAKKFLNLDIKPSGGKINAQTGERRSADPKVGIDKPDWRSGSLESQWNPEAIVHELAHLMLLPQGVGLAEGQKWMDQNYSDVQRKHGYMQQKRSDFEVQPMAAEQVIRRHLGLPASQVHIKVPNENAPKRMSLEDPSKEIATRVPKQTRSGETKWEDHIRQAKFLSPENKQRLHDVFSGKLAFHPEKGWTPKQHVAPSAPTVTQPASTKIAASDSTENDLQKGAKQRLMNFDPTSLKPDEKNKLSLWTDPYDTEHPVGRNSLPRMTGNGRKRALHSLHATTKARWNNDKNEREFLLHRGVSSEEYNNVIGLGKVSHPHRSSWSPKHTNALSFAHNYDVGDVPGRVLSAWVPESAIHHVPMQWGSMTKDKGPSEWRNEHEVIIDPGDYETATHDDLHNSEEDFNLESLFKTEYNPADGVTDFMPLYIQDKESEDQASNINKMIKAGKTYKLKNKGLFTGDSFIVGTTPEDSWLIKIQPENRPGIRAVQATGSQPVKEAAFYQISKDVFGLDHYIPKAILGHIIKDKDSIYAVAIKMLPPQYVQMSKANEEHHGISRGIMQKYHLSGLTQMLAFMLYVLGDLDNHGNNYMSDGIHIKLIDHGSSFADIHSEDKSDKKMFVPYILRTEGFKKKASDNDKLRYMPVIHTPEVMERVKHYIASICPDKLEDLISSYNLDPSACVARLKIVQHLVKFGDRPDLVLNNLWVMGAPQSLIDRYFSKEVL